MDVKQSPSPTILCPRRTHFENRLNLWKEERWAVRRPGDWMNNSNRTELLPLSEHLMCVLQITQDWQQRTNVNKQLTSCVAGYTCNWRLIGSLKQIKDCLKYWYFQKGKGPKKNSERTMIASQSDETHTNGYCPLSFYGLFLFTEQKKGKA